MSNPFFTPHLVPRTPKALPGWECPVCHIGQAPWMPYCVQCVQKKSLKQGRLKRPPETVR
jgi:hypothetical protein